MSSTLTFVMILSNIALIFHMRVIDVSYLSAKLGELEKETLAALRKQARRLIGR